MATTMITTQKTAPTTEAMIMMIMFVERPPTLELSSSLSFSCSSGFRGAESKIYTDNLFHIKFLGLKVLKGKYTQSLILN